MDKPTEVPIDHASLEYAPTSGIKPLREAVARLYNDLYRQGKDSQYTWENVSILLLAKIAVVATSHTTNHDLFITIVICRCVLFLAAELG